MQRIMLRNLSRSNPISRNRLAWPPTHINYKEALHRLEILEDLVEQKKEEIVNEKKEQEIVNEKKKQEIVNGKIKL